MGKGSNAKRPRAAALARAQHGGAPVRLSGAEKKVLEEALRLGADLAGEVASRTTAYGRWLLEEVFDNDSTAALDGKTKNPVWVELVRRAGGPTLPVSRRMLYVALQIAAYDRRITSQTWRGLDAGRKEILLPLDDARLLPAAEHVSKFDLSQAKTREYVGELLARDSSGRARITGPVLAGRIKKLRESLGSAAALRRVRALHGELDHDERRAIVGEIDQLREVLSSVARELRGR